MTTYYPPSPVQRVKRSTLKKQKAQELLAEERDQETSSKNGETAITVGKWKTGILIWSRGGDFEIISLNVSQE